jgi:hypothetical protein
LCIRKYGLQIDISAGWITPFGKRVHIHTHLSASPAEDEIAALPRRVECEEYIDVIHGRTNPIFGVQLPVGLTALQMHGHLAQTQCQTVSHPDVRVYAGESL